MQSYLEKNEIGRAHTACWVDERRIQGFGGKT